MNRRYFLSNLTKLAVVNTTVYIVGSALSKQHGGLVAGAKSLSFYSSDGCDETTTPACFADPVYPSCTTLGVVCYDGCHPMDPTLGNKYICVP